MKSEPPPEAPHGSGKMMKAYNDLRAFIMARQVAGFGGAAKNVDIISTPTGKFISIGEITGITNGSGGGPGACCVGGACHISTRAACVGTYFGPGVACTPGICTGIGIVGGCCHGVSCITTTDIACVSSGGHFEGGSCSPTACTGPDCGAGFGACCSSTGGCTSTPPGGCGGTFVCGQSCSSIVCVPTEPDGACCASPTSGCTITTFPGCGGIFHEFIDCTGISCEHDFCGPENHYCACDRASPRCLPNLSSPPCTGGGPMVDCASCAVPGVPGSYCCCACCWTAFGPACTFCG